MARVINHTTGALPLPTLHVVPRLGALETTDDVIRCLDNWAILEGQIANGSISVEYDPEPEAAPEPKGKKPVTPASF